MKTIVNHRKTAVADTTKHKQEHNPSGFLLEGSNALKSFQQPSHLKIVHIHAEHSLGQLYVAYKKTENTTRCLKRKITISRPQELEVL